MLLGRAMLIVLPCGLLATAFTLAAPPESAEAKKLLMERRNVLKQITDLQSKAYESGQVRIDSVLLAQSNLFEADLELAEQKSQRIEICERLVKMLENIEAVSQKLHAAGEATIVDVLSSKAARLKAQAQLTNELQGGN
jgi:outer membrane protein TolC